MAEYIDLEAAIAKLTALEVTELPQLRRKDGRKGGQRWIM